MCLVLKFSGGFGYIFLLFNFCLIHYSSGNSYVPGETSPGSSGVANVEGCGSNAGCICNGTSADAMSKSGSGHVEGDACMSTGKLSVSLELKLQMTYIHTIHSYTINT